MRSTTYVCIPCRSTGRAAGFGATTPVCPRCGQPMSGTDRRWRPPRRTDDRAWALLAAGQWLTEPSTDRARYRRADLRLPHQLRSRRRAAPLPHAPVDPVAAVAELLDAPSQPEAVVAFASHPAVRVRLTLARSAETPTEALRPLLTDADPEVRATALEHPRAPVTPRLLRHAARAPESRIRLAAARHARTPADALARLLDDSSALIAETAAAHPGTRQSDLLPRPLRLVPPGRLGQLLEAHAGRPLRGPGSAAALRLLEELRGSGNLTVREALTAAAAVLG